MTIIVTIIVVWSVLVWLETETLDDDDDFDDDLDL